MVFGREGATKDHLYGLAKLKDIYEKANPDYVGRYTVPVLWDKQQHRIVNNESREIIIDKSTFNDYFTKGNPLYPESKQSEINDVIDKIYDPINNGVYRCGFAESQEAYEESFNALFSALEHWDSILAKQNFYVGMNSH